MDNINIFHSDWCSNFNRKRVHKNSCKIYYIFRLAQNLKNSVETQHSNAYSTFYKTIFCEYEENITSVFDILINCLKKVDGSTWIDSIVSITFYIYTIVS